MSSTPANLESNSAAPALGDDAQPTIDPAASAVTHWFGWAAFLAASWTWCIGMFLPYLLVRDYGIPAWFVFAVPNVIGAAAMGWVLKSADASVRVVATHRLACQAFSAVTIAFHMFFVMAVIGPLSHSLATKGSDLAVGMTVAASVMFYLYMTRRRDGDRVLAFVVLAISMAIMVVTTAEIQTIAATTPQKMASLTWQTNIDLLWLAPVCFFGFLACPYLDLTFHRARQFSDRPRASFGWGFGLLFLIMIIFTLIYSRPLLAVGGMNTWIAACLVVHMIAQSAFTISAHARELQHNAGHAAAIAAVLTLVTWVGIWFLPDGRIYFGLRANEILYRGFMGFYGLVFPAYVWLVMIPAARAGAKPTAGQIAVYGLAVLIALPTFWLGFIARQPIWLVPGMAVVLLARLIAPRSGTISPAAPG